MFAIAAMSRNRVVGKGNAIPWHIPEEFRWFRRTTLGGVVVMGRRTFESLPKPLDGRTHVVLTRDPARMMADPALTSRFAARAGPEQAGAVVELELPKIPGTHVYLATSIDPLTSGAVQHRVWLCGGVQLYEQFLGRCSELYLSVIDRDVEGDAVFPPFEHLFDAAGVAAEAAEFRVLRYVRNGAADVSARSPERGREAPSARTPAARAS